MSFFAPKAAAAPAASGTPQQLERHFDSGAQACTPDGTVYDIVNIVSYIQKFKRHPVTGDLLALRDVISLNFAKNGEGEYHCPVLHKVIDSNNFQPAPAHDPMKAPRAESQSHRALKWMTLPGDSYCRRSDWVTLTSGFRLCAGVHREHTHRGSSTHRQRVLL